MKFRLSAPKFITWLIAFILGLAGTLIYFNVITLGKLNEYSIYFMIASIGLLLLGTLIKGM